MHTMAENTNTVETTAVETATTETTETEAPKAPKAKTARINLNVPYPARKYAKACGAYWDRLHKVWYTYAGHAGAKRLARFMAEPDRKVYGFAVATTATTK
jgi:hypothetical protein